MGRGRQIESGLKFWPRKKGDNKSHEGDEIIGVYQGLADGEYDGKPKKEALFLTTEGPVHVGSGTFVKIFAPNLKEGTKYVVVFTGYKDTDNGEAFQFEVFEHDGAA